MWRGLCDGIASVMGEATAKAVSGEIIMGLTLHQCLYMGAGAFRQRIQIIPAFKRAYNANRMFSCEFAQFLRDPEIVFFFKS